MKYVALTARTVLFVTLSLALLVLNPTILLTGCGPRSTGGGYGGCPTLDPSKQDALEDFMEMPRRFQFERADGTLEVSFEWIDVESIAARSEFIATAHASSPCDDFEAIDVTALVTITWTPDNQRPQIIAQDIRFHPAIFLIYAVGAEGGGDLISNSVAAGDLDGYWFFRIRRDQPDEYELTMTGWVAPRNHFLDVMSIPEPGRRGRREEPEEPDEPPCWFAIRDGELVLFERDMAPAEPWSLE